MLTVNGEPDEASETMFAQAEDSKRLWCNGDCTEFENRFAQRLRGAGELNGTNPAGVL